MPVFNHFTQTAALRAIGAGRCLDFPATSGHGGDIGNRKRGGTAGPAFRAGCPWPECGPSCQTCTFITFHFDPTRIRPQEIWNKANTRFPAERAISRAFGLQFFPELPTPLRSGVTKVRSAEDGATRAEPLPNSTPDKQGPMRFLILVCATNTSVSAHPKSEGACLVEKRSRGQVHNGT